MNTEQAAIDLYDAYCAKVGGHAWNGAPLPMGAEFFADPNKKKQADAWRAVAERAKVIFTTTEQ